MWVDELHRLKWIVHHLLYRDEFPNNFMVQILFYDKFIKVHLNGK
jgi:hypothetical protein